MKAIMAYDYMSDIWRCWGICYVEMDIEEYMNHRLTDKGKYLYPEVVSVECDSIKGDKDRYSVILSDDAELPEVLTLVQSIAKNKEILARGI